MLFKIGVIPGDGIGPEVIAEGLAILGDVAQLEGFDYTLERFDLGGERFLATGEVLPAGVIQQLRGCDVIMLGAVGHPEVAPGILEKGILLRLRFDFHQYINLRPVRLYPGVETPIRGKGPRTSTWWSSARTTRIFTWARAASLARVLPRRWPSRPRSTRGPGSIALCGSPSSRREPGPGRVRFGG